MNLSHPYYSHVYSYLLRQPPSPEEKQHKVRLMFGNGLRSEIWKEFVTRFNIKQISEIYGATEGNISFCKLSCEKTRLDFTNSQELLNKLLCKYVSDD